MPTSRKITITLPDELIDKLDLWGKHVYASKSDVIRMALVEYLHQPQRLLITVPQKEALDKMYEQLKEFYPYLPRQDEEMIKLLYDQKFGKPEE